MSGFPDPMHYARLAQLEAALAAVLRAFVAEQPFPDATTPNGLTVTLDESGLDIVYTRDGQHVAGEGV